jgi:hypothetical protein
VCADIFAKALQEREHAVEDNDDEDREAELRHAARIAMAPAIHSITAKK